MAVHGESMECMPIITWRDGLLEQAVAAIPAGAEVLQVVFAGLCPSELSLAPDWSVGLGHELVVQRENGLHVLAPFATCGQCPECRSGQFKACLLVDCPSLVWNGHGGLGGQVLLRDERFLVPIPDTSRPHSYVLAEPAAAGVAAAGSVIDERVAVVGLGAVGLGAALAAADTAKDVAVIAQHQWQHSIAVELGLRAIDPQDHVTCLFGDVIVAASSVDALRTAYSLLQPRGRLHLVGMNSDSPEWRASAGGGYELFRSEIIIHHHYMYSIEELRRAVQLVYKHEEVLQAALFGPFPLAELNRAPFDGRRGRRFVVGYS
jgi:threonine dehydrogenase-like Zn-dependent dehydrogenase